MTSVSCAVEGDLDEAVARRLLEHVGLDAGPVYGRMGKEHIERSIGGYANAARRNPWFVLVDLDSDAPCGAALISAWLPHPPALLAFRVAVRAVESWILADRSNLAHFLRVSRDVVPRGVDALRDPKLTLVNLARRSNARNLREGLPPRAGSGRAIGPLYVTELSGFVTAQWDVDAAAVGSDSLARCLSALQALG